MSIKDMINEKFSTIDNMLEVTDIQLSRTYLYRLVNDNTVNPSLEVIEELARILETSIDQIVKAVYSTRHRD